MVENKETPELLFHVVTGGAWDGGALEPLAIRVPEPAEADLVELARRWPDLAAGEDLDDPDSWCASTWRRLEEYFAGDAHEVHLHATEEEARDFVAEFGGEILAVLTEGLQVRTGREYPHPVVLGSIPAANVRRAEAK